MIEVYYMFLAGGFEETEALVTLDLMRRARVDVKTVGVGSLTVTGAHGIIVAADIAESDTDINNCDGILLPGGMPGTENLFSSETVSRILTHCHKNKKLIAAICAAPIILGRKGMLDGKQAVCFPGFENEMGKAIFSDMQCVSDANIITAKGAGAVFEFSHKIIEYIKSKKEADAIIAQIQHKGI